MNPYEVDHFKSHLTHYLNACLNDFGKGPFVHNICQAFVIASFTKLDKSKEEEKKKKILESRVLSGEESALIDQLSLTSLHVLSIQKEKILFSCKLLLFLQSTEKFKTTSCKINEGYDETLGTVMENCKYHILREYAADVRISEGRKRDCLLNLLLGFFFNVHFDEGQLRAVVFEGKYVELFSCQHPGDHFLQTLCDVEPAFPEYSEKAKMLCLWNNSKRGLFLGWGSCLLSTALVLDFVERWVSLQCRLLLLLHIPVFLFVYCGMFIDKVLFEHRIRLLKKSESYRCLKKYLVAVRHIAPDDQGDFCLTACKNNGIPHVEVKLFSQVSAIDTVFQRFSLFGAKKRQVLYRNTGYKFWFFDLDEFGLGSSGAASNWGRISWNDIEFDILGFHFVLPRDMAITAILLSLKEDGIEVENDKGNFVRVKCTTQGWNLAQHVLVTTLKLWKYPHPNLHTNKRFINKQAVYIERAEHYLKLLSEDLTFYTSKPLKTFTEKEIDVVSHSMGWVEEVTYEELIPKHGMETILEYAADPAAYERKIKQIEPSKKAKKILQNCKSSVEFYDENCPDWRETKSLLTRKTQRRYARKETVTKKTVGVITNREMVSRDPVFRKVELKQDYRVNNARLRMVRARLKKVYPGSSHMIREVNIALNAAEKDRRQRKIRRKNQSMGYGEFVPAPEFDTVGFLRRVNEFKCRELVVPDHMFVEFNLAKEYWCYKRVSWKVNQDAIQSGEMRKGRHIKCSKHNRSVFLLN